MESPLPAETGHEAVLSEIENNAAQLAKMANALNPKALFLLLAGVTYIVAAALSNWIAENQHENEIH